MPSKPKFKRPEEIPAYDPKTESLHLRVPKDLKERLDKASKKSGRSVTVIVTTLLSDYLDWLDASK